MTQRPWQRFFIVLLLLVMGLSPSVAFAQGATGRVSGVVQGGTGPAVRAKVVVRSSTASNYEAIGFTNEEGRFTLSGVPVGAVRVLVYNDADRLIGEGAALLTTPGQTITVQIDRVPLPSQ